MSVVKLEDLKYIGPEVHESEITETVEEPVIEVEESVETVEEPVAQEPVISSDVEDLTEVPVDEFENAEPAKVEPSENKIVNVNKLRIYSIPSTKVPARSFTGNVVVIGHIDKFAILEYVRAGFGKVKGYAIGSELPR